MLKLRLGIAVIAVSSCALAFAQDVAKGYINERTQHATLHPLLSALDMSAKLLEELLEEVLPEVEEEPRITQIM